jgi:hypothetical protein
MKKLLLTVVAFAALALPAHADSLPKEVLGKWCYMPDDESRGDKPGTTWERTHFEWFSGSKCNEADVMTVRHKDWTGLESGCSFTSVKTKFDPNIARNTKTMGVNVAHVSARCSGEGCSWRSDFVLYFSQGVLYMRGRDGKEKCDG